MTGHVVRFPPDTPVVVVFHETPKKLPEVKIGGRSRLVLVTLFETTALPTGWLPYLVGAAEVWVPTEFNRQTFRAAGVPATRLEKLPICLDPVSLLAPCSELDIRANRFRFLSVVSNLNRKDVSGLLRAYCLAFTPADDVTLLVKFNEKYSTDQLTRLLAEQFSTQDPADVSLPHIVIMRRDLSERDMRALYRWCDVHVSTERAKGWDLPSMQSMALGRLNIGIGWSGNTEFMCADNSVLIEPEPELVLASEELTENPDYYRLQEWATFSTETLASRIREVYENPQLHDDRRWQGQRDVLKNFSHLQVGETLRELLGRYQSHDYADSDPATVRISDRPIADGVKAPITADEAVRRYPELEPYIPGHDLEGWVARRRRIWRATDTKPTHQTDAPTDPGRTAPQSGRHSRPRPPGAATPASRRPTAHDKQRPP